MAAKKNRYYKKKPASPTSKRGIARALKLKKIREEQAYRASQELKPVQAAVCGGKEVNESGLEITRAIVKEGVMEQEVVEDLIEEVVEEEVVEEEVAEEVVENIHDNFESFPMPLIQRVYARPTSSKASPPMVQRLTMKEVAMQFPNIAKVAQQAQVVKRLGFDPPKIKASTSQTKRSKLEAPTREVNAGSECSRNDGDNESPEAAAELAELMARQKEAEQHSLVVEKFHRAGQDENINQLKQRRIVDIRHFITEVRMLEGHECTAAPGVGHFSFLSETHYGLQSILNFQCFSCGRIRRLSTMPGKPDEINSACVKAIVSEGKGHEHLTRILKTLDIPAPSYSTFKKHKDKLKQTGSTRENPVPSTTAQSCPRISYTETQHSGAHYRKV